MPGAEGRTHCRYTGPYYLAMIVPVAVLASGIVAANFYGWLALVALIVFGGWIIWWTTERAWGQFSAPEVMSAIGTKQTSACALPMSAFGGKADMRWTA